MKFTPTVVWYANARLSRQFQRPHLIHNFSASPFSGNDYRQNLNSSGPLDDNFPSLSSFYKKLDKVERNAHDRFGLGSSSNVGSCPGPLDGLGDSYDTMTDGMDYKLKKAATYFEFDTDEVAKEDYIFRLDVNFSPGMMYDTKDLDLGRPGVRRPVKRAEFETTTEEVLEKADFRNVRFLANFITEAGIIIKRSKTGISAKAQRKIAREIKTARAFGLMPFTTMGTKSFKVGMTMEDQDEDFGYEAYDYNFVDERE